MNCHPLSVRRASRVSHQAAAAPFAMGNRIPERIAQYCKIHLNPQIATEVFDNCQMTSTKNEILKAEAVHSFTRVLLHYHVNYFQDIPTVISSA